jgi:hypothetical protein
MNPNEQNKAIAEYCGWTYTNGMGPVGSLHHPTNCTCFDGDGCRIPNYHLDLNEMHEAELFMLSVDPILYKQVYLKTYMDCYFNGGVSAEASERAEAFLKTIGKWKE